MMTTRFTYSEAIREASHFLLSNLDDFLIMGQGLWSPWYVGDTMRNLENEFGKHRVIDTPVAEAAVTGAAVGASIVGCRTLVVHPRMDFAILGLDAIINQAANWSFMFGEQSRAPVTVRAIINRGGEQGPQHSQSLHAWFAHIPGLRVVMPYSPIEARDLLIASVLSDEPVIYVDDRWLYETSEEWRPIEHVNLSDLSGRTLHHGSDITLAACGYATLIAHEAARSLHGKGISCDVVNLPVISPFRPQALLDSVRRTGRLLVVDQGWGPFGFSAEVIATACEFLPPGKWKTPPSRITLPNTPAPTASNQERHYYLNERDVESAVLKSVRSS